MEFITLTRDDPEFRPYLLGTFSSSHLALPVETFHPQTARERVTFRVVPIAEIQRPNWWEIYFWACRPELLALTMGPAIAAWLNHRDAMGEWTKWPSWSALLGIFFLHTAVFLLNDVQDHLHGLDRLSRRRGSQVIQRGWAAARSMKIWAWMNLTLAVLFGLPAFYNAPVELAAVCVSAVLCLAIILGKVGTRWGLSDLALLLLFGPLLTAGIALASFGTLNGRDLALGLGFGALTVWVFQARQFEQLFRSVPEGLHTFLGYWDFDRARMICVVEGIVLIVALPVLGVLIHLPLKLLVLLPLVTIPQILFMWRMARAASPLSSNLLNSDRWALGAHMSWSAWWILALGCTWL